jgi:hypothetical protein
MIDDEEKALAGDVGSEEDEKKNLDPKKEEAKKEGIKDEGSQKAKSGSK